MVLNKKGVTLMELIVIIALLTIVIGAAFSLLIAGNKSFNRSKISSDVHYKVRMVSDYIRDELRYATDIEIVSGNDGLEVGEHFITIVDSAIYHVFQESVGVEKEETISFNTTEIEPIEFVLGIAGGSNNTLEYKVVGFCTDDVKKIYYTHSASTTVLLNNIKNKEFPGDIAIKYTKP